MTPTCHFLKVFRHYAEQLNFKYKTFVESDLFAFSCRNSTIANELASRRLDYCNSLLFSLIPLRDLQELQMVQKNQNSLAMTKTRILTCQLIMPMLHSLHWMLVEQRIHFKIRKHYKVTKRPYHYSMLVPQTNKYCSRAMDAITSHVPRTRTVWDSRAFSIDGPKLWKLLPNSVQSLNSFMLSRSELETHRLQLATLLQIDFLYIVLIKDWFWCTVSCQLLH